MRLACCSKRLWTKWWKKRKSSGIQKSQLKSHRSDLKAFMSALQKTLNSCHYRAEIAKKKSNTEYPPVIGWITAQIIIPACTYGLMGSSIKSTDWKRRLGPGLWMVLYDMQAPLQSGQLQQYSSFLGHPWRTEVKGNFPSGQNSHQCPCCSFGLAGERASSWAVAHGSAGWSLTWEEHNWELGDKEIWEEVCG